MRTFLRAALGVAAVLLSLLVVSQAQAAKVTSLVPWQPSNTYVGKADIDGRAAPKLEPRAFTNAVRKGQWVRISCQVEGELAYGSTLWDKVGDYYVPDQLLKTYSDGRLAGAPKCGGAAPAAPAPGKAPAPLCQDFTIYGVRGSSEPAKGHHGMGRTVGPAADAAKAQLPGRSVKLVGIVYPASPVKTLLTHPATFRDSMDLGKTVLLGVIRKKIKKCPATKIAVIGYSQGAGVVSEAMRDLPKSAFAHVRAALLFADTYSAGNTDSAQNYIYSNRNNASPVKRSGHGIFGKRKLPAALATKIDVCFVEDLICNSSSSALRTAAQAFFVKSHTSYKSWVPSFFGSLTGFDGAELGASLRG